LQPKTGTDHVAVPFVLLGREQPTLALLDPRSRHGVVGSRLQFDTARDLRLRLLDARL
jgi:hypothetical protein